MLDPTTIPSQPKRLSHQAVENSVYRSVGKIRFGRNISTRTELLRLYDHRFALELALCSDFCTVPPGWLEHHHVVLPTALRPISEAQILFRLRRMIHAPQDQDAISFILAAASAVRGTGKKARRFWLVDSLDLFAKDLYRARSTDPEFIDALVSGEFAPCLGILAEGRLNKLAPDQAYEHLISMATMWMLHDLQVIAARLHQAIYRPTNGLIEGLDAGPQSFQSTHFDLLKLAEMAAIASKMLNPRPGPPTREDQDAQRRFWGFVSATGFKSFAKQIGLKMGFSEAQLDPKCQWSVPVLEKIFRRAAAGGVFIGEAMQSVSKAKWDDGAPIKKGCNAKAVSHMSAAAFRYGMDAPVALARAIIAFIDFSEQLPAFIERSRNGDRTWVWGSTKIETKIKASNHKVTFERMFAAYRAIILRDPSYLRAEVLESLPHTGGRSGHSPVFASKASAQAWRHDFLMGHLSAVEERMGAHSPLFRATGAEPGKPTDYGRKSFNKAVALTERDTKAFHVPYHWKMTPDLSARFTPPPPPDLPN